MLLSSVNETISLAACVVIFLMNFGHYVSLHRVEVADMHYLDGTKRKVFERFLKLCIWKESWLGFHQITRHLNFFNENCFACGRFMLRCLIQRIEDITKFLKCKQAVLYTVQGSPLISSRVVGRALDVIISLILLSPSSYVKCMLVSSTLM